MIKRYDLVFSCLAPTVKLNNTLEFDQELAASNQVPIEPVSSANPVKISFDKGNTVSIS